MAVLNPRLPDVMTFTMPISVMDKELPDWREGRAEFTLFETRWLLFEWVMDSGSPGLVRLGAQRLVPIISA